VNLAVDDVIASFYAHARSAIPGQFDKPDIFPLRDHLLKVLDNASIFYMGDTHEAEEVMADIGRDLYQDLADDLPLPFSDVILIGKNERERLLQAPDLQAELAEASPEERREVESKWTGVWWATLISRTPLDLVPEERRVPFVVEWKDRHYIFLEFMYAEKYKQWKPSILRWVAFNGHPKKDPPEGEFALEYKSIYGGLAYPDRPAAEQNNLKSTFYFTTLISHPSNYIVRETPSLTSGEQHRLPKRGFPDQKRPRYIVVDHDVLVRMSEGKTPDQAEDEESRVSPVPHKRRGHWRRLADRCVHAKDRGVEKVFVRPSYIGKTEFEIGNRKYHVLLDFKAGAQTATADQRAGS